MHYKLYAVKSVKCGRSRTRAPGSSPHPRSWTARCISQLRTRACFMLSTPSPALRFFPSTSNIGQCSLRQQLPAGPYTSALIRAGSTPSISRHKKSRGLSKPKIPRKTPPPTPNQTAAFSVFFYDDMVTGVQKMLSVGGILSAPAVAGNSVYVGSADGNVYALM